MAICPPAVQRGREVADRTPSIAPLARCPVILPLLFPRSASFLCPLPISLFIKINGATARRRPRRKESSGPPSLPPPFSASSSAAAGGLPLLRLPSSLPIRQSQAHSVPHRANQCFHSPLSGHGHPVQQRRRLSSFSLGPSPAWPIHPRSPFLAPI